jgi:hypothetical protein
VAGAVVGLVELNSAAVSGPDGSLLFPQIARGPFTVVIQRLGFVPAVVRVSIPGEEVVGKPIIRGLSGPRVSRYKIFAYGEGWNVIVRLSSGL